MKKFTLFLIIVLTLIALFSACSRKEQYFIFGTTVEINLSGAGAAKSERLIINRLTELDKTLSTSLENSDVKKINEAQAGEAVKVSADTLKMFEIAFEIFVASEGAFNPAVFPLVELWRFSPDTFTIKGDKITPPDASEIAALLPYTYLFDFTVDFERGTVTKKYSQMKIDFGAIAKGYAAEEVFKLVENAEGLINIGGNIYVVGDSKKIGIGNPRASEFPYFGSLRVLSSITTSGDYERYYLDAEDESRRYCHIIDGRTGYPAASGLISVTVLGGDGGRCDAIATAALALGAQAGAALIKYYGLSAVIITDSNTYHTVNADGFTLTDTAYIFAVI
ncbi:MAG TPA: FAD:protein FMN transferase [Eubacteriales bacterium]|jgi:thiamine biosynthesis lipoprotein|nr:FAD:protein FMN transferase [Clostridia bacterium]HRR89795.1 FAD:protein FMN transferase [Eubacteriales bacterium]HRU84013.1 FAD:protein FMN transferase [Eubacteriales bacterium]